MTQNNEVSQADHTNHDNDTIAMSIADTQFSQQVFLSEDEQAAQLKKSSMAHFKIIDILGKGGMGAVYKAKDLALERFVAIKMLRVSQAQQPLILAEAKTISQLNHPNIVTVHDIARDGDASFIVMEWINGKPLNAVIPSTGLALNIAVDYAKQMAMALDCAHQQHIIHRDIKPQNIMVDVNGRVKILDFGIAGLIGSAPSAEPLVEKEPLTEQAPSVDLAEAEASIIVGSPQYMSPEQIQGHGSDARSDLFSFGIVLYEMLTGVKPFLGLNLAQIRQAISTGQYTPLTEFDAERKTKQQAKLPSELIAVVDKLLASTPSARYQSATELVKDIAVIDDAINQKKNWWQQQHWLTKTLLVLPVIAVLAWNVRSTLFPPSTQELIARQLIESKKIAFLPFDNISGDPVLQIFSDGVATMLSSDLAEVGYQQGDGSTWVLPTSEISKLEDPSVAGIYNKYGVDFIITGSIQHMGSTRSIHLSLVNGADGRQLKSQQLTIDANNLFAAQTQIRKQVMTLLGWQIPTELTAKFAQQKPDFDGAYKHYLQGQGYLYRFDHKDNISKALESFSAAISIDSNYGDAYVGLAEAQLRSFITTKDVRLLALMVKTVEQLILVASEHPLLSYLQGELRFNQGEYADAIELFSKSIDLQPSFLKAYTGLSYAYVKLGDFAKAEQILLKAYEIMPNNNTILTDLGVFHFENGDYHRAIVFFELLAQQAPNNYIAYLNISACHYLNGDFKKAILAAKKAVKVKPDYIAYSNLGTSYFILKNYDKAVEAFESMIALNNHDYMSWGNLADAYRFANNDKYEESFRHAIMLAEQALGLNINDKAAIASLAYYHANIGNSDKVHFYAQQINENDLGENQFSVAAAYAQLNLNSAAMKYLTFAIKNNYSIAEISNSPLFNNLESESKYQQLMSTTIE
ncbi:serine/threonine-protein kinase [Cognaticolwellia mytili]|uniref:serine/threonine-protein kinase n=1 Tax=Cognaticolwellia mytili TaxID=1888913 RepID=UPI000A172AA7|nr:serine/threonine-protein kinase [Cognaticolwellia mytili]